MGVFQRFQRRISIVDRIVVHDDVVVTTNMLERKLVETTARVVREPKRVEDKSVDNGLWGRFDFRRLQRRNGG